MKKQYEGWCDACKRRIQVIECGDCQGRFCEECKYVKDKCPYCNGYVGDDQNCRVGGGGCGK